MSSPLYRDAALADSSRKILREEEDGSKWASTRTILATVLSIIPTEPPAQEKQLAQPLVEIGTGDDGVRRRPTYKDSFNSVRTLAAAPAVDPLIQPPAQNKESAPDEMDDGAVPPRRTYMDGVGRNRTRAQVVVYVPPSVPPAQDIESARDAMDAGAAPRLTYTDSVGMIRSLATVVEHSVPPSIPPTQNNESAPDATDNGATRRPAYKNSFGSVRFAATATAEAVRPHAQKKEIFFAPDEDEAVRIRRPSYMDRADTHPSKVAAMPPRMPLGQDNAATLDEIEPGAVGCPMYKDCFGDLRHSKAEIPPLSVAEIPPIADVPLVMKPKEVDEASESFESLPEDAGTAPYLLDHKRAVPDGDHIVIRKDDLAEMVAHFQTITESQRHIQAILKKYQPSHHDHHYLSI
jgi:hypothetical protein